jgi:hypothetical protein
MIRGKVTVRDYGEQYVEASWGLSVEGRKKQCERGESKTRSENIERSLRRTKAEVRRKCMAGGLDHLLSLTYRENVTDKIHADRCFESFIRLVHSYLPRWQYVCVSERQHRGAIHYHVAVKGYQDVTLLRSLWRTIVGEGNIDVEYRKTVGGIQWKRARLAGYLTKYIGKGMEAELNKRRFRASLGIVIPEEVFYLSWRFTPKDYALSKVESLGGKVGYVWCSEESEGKYGWACSWG